MFLRRAAVVEPMGGYRKSKGWTCGATCGSASWLFNSKITASTRCNRCGKLGQCKAYAVHAAGGHKAQDDSAAASVEMDADFFAVHLAKLQDQFPTLKESADLKLLAEANRKGPMPKAKSARQVWVEAQNKFRGG